MPQGEVLCQPGPEVAREAGVGQPGDGTKGTRQFLYGLYAEFEGRAS